MTTQKGPIGILCFVSQEKKSIIKTEHRTSSTICLIHITQIIHGFVGYSSHILRWLWLVTTMAVRLEGYRTEYRKSHNSQCLREATNICGRGVDRAICSHIGACHSAVRKLNLPTYSVFPVCIVVCQGCSPANLKNLSGRTCCNSTSSPVSHNHP